MVLLPVRGRDVSEDPPRSAMGAERAFIFHEGLILLHL
jgi:hypothetical protein